MKAFDLLKTAIQNTFRSKIRTLLTVLAIFVGAFTLTLTNSLGAGISDYVDKQVAAAGADDMMFVTTTPAAGGSDGPAEYDPDAMMSTSGLSGSSAFKPLDDDDLKGIKEIDGVVKATPLRIVTPDFITREGEKLWEVETNMAGSIAKADLAAGAQLSRDVSDHQVVVPTTYLEPLGLDSASEAVGKTVTIGVKNVLGEENRIDAKVVGVSNESLIAKGVSMNTALMSAIADAKTSGVDNVSNAYPMVIAYFDPSVPAEDIEGIKADLSKQGYLAQTTKDQLGMAQTVIAGIIGVLNGFAVLILLAASFGIVNTLFMSVQERTREIGLMKAMGMSNGKVYALFSLEAIFIGFLGSALGAGAAAVLGTVLSDFLATGPLSGLPGLHLMIFEPATMAFVIGLIMLIAFLSGTLPARKAAKQDPIDALRYE